MKSKGKLQWGYIFIILFTYLVVLSGCSTSSGGNTSISSGYPQTTISESPTPPLELSETETPTEQITTTDPETPPPPSQITRNLTVHIIDVGQADSILIMLPNGENMLIDGGEANKSSVVQSYLNQNNITTIDYLVATHPHSDHIGGLPGIINNFTIKYVYMPNKAHTTNAYNNLITSISNKNLRPIAAKAGVNILSLPNIQIDIIAPMHDNYSELNDFSAVIKVTYENTSFLFMGDAETTSERDITADVSANVLKIGHHGSDTSTSEEFLKHVNPAYAVISSGKGNSYGHPTDIILQRLNNAGVAVFRTDMSGTVIFTSDGKNITVNVDATPYQQKAYSDSRERRPKTTLMLSLSRNQLKAAA